VTVQPIENEVGRFFVQSASRAEVQHTVDLQYCEEPWLPPKPACGCESNFIHGRCCPHLRAVVAFELQRINETSLQTTQP
jgi:hypothetical protein